MASWSFAFPTRAGATTRTRSIAGPHRGLGLISVRERMSLIGGTVDIRTALGGGTQGVLTVPLAPRPAASSGEVDSMSIRVLLVEDHRMVREALREVLTKVPDMEVVGEAGDARDGLEQARSLAPDVIVLDIRLPDLNGIEVAARLRDSGSTAKIVALSAFSDKRFVTEMLRSGASGYVTKSAAGTELVSAIRAVASGQGYFSPDIAATLVAEVREGHRVRPNSHWPARSGKYCA